MGTNYYWHNKPDCECCGRPFEPIHIGKSSGGWCFSLHVIPEDNIHDLPDWQELWETPGSFIRDEYQEKITTEEMLSIITERRWNRHRSGSFDYIRNHGEPGPNNLVRHTIGNHCIKHGSGTWDCIVGCFS